MKKTVAGKLPVLPDGPAGRPVGNTGDRFFHVLDHLESIWNFFFNQICDQKTFEIYRRKTRVLYREKMKLSCHRDKSRNFSKFFWAKIFAEKFFSPNRLQMIQNVKKTVAGKSPVLPDGPSGGPNLTIFACVGTQTKYRFRVSGYLDQK